MPQGISQCAAASSLGNARWVAAITRSTRFIDLSPPDKLRDSKSVPQDSMANENPEPFRQMSRQIADRARHAPVSHNLAWLVLVGGASIVLSTAVTLAAIVAANRRIVVRGRSMAPLL